MRGVGCLPTDGSAAGWLPAPKGVYCCLPGAHGQEGRMHGIVSLLDPSHAAQVAAVWARLQDQLDLQGMDIPPFPHVSYHVAEQYEVAVVEPILRAFAAHTAPLEVVT